MHVLSKGNVLSAARSRFILENGGQDGLGVHHEAASGCILSSFLLQISWDIFEGPGFVLLLAGRRQSVTQRFTAEVTVLFPFAVRSNFGKKAKQNDTLPRTKNDSTSI